MIGAIEEVNSHSRVFHALGKRIPLDAVQILHAEGGADTLAAGQLVWVDQVAATNKQARYVVYLLPEQYVPGATEVFVSGRVSRINDDGSLDVGTLRIDLNALLTQGPVVAAVGDAIQIFGVQPNLGGQVLATELRGVGGSGRRVGTSTTRGAAGNGLQGVGGSGVIDGVGGSGLLNGVGGSGFVNGVGGSGLLNGGGSGFLNGVGGSGLLNGVGGSGLLNGVGGSGRSVALGAAAPSPTDRSQ